MRDGKSRIEAFGNRQPLPTEPSIEVALRAVGEFLKSTRTALGLTQEQMAASTLGKAWPVSRATVGSIEKGKTSPAMVTILAITEVLHIDPMEVIDRMKLAVAPPPGAEKMSFEDLDRQAQELFHAGHFRETLSILDMMASMLQRRSGAPPRNSHAQAELEIRRATVLKRLGALTAAKSSAERAVSLSIDSRGLHAGAYTALSSIYTRLGNLPMGVNAADTAVRISNGCGESVACQAWLAKGHACWACQEYEQARRAFLHALPLAEKAGDNHHLIHCEGNIGSCLFKLGHRKHAESRIRKAVDLARKHRRPEKESLWLVELGKIALAGKRFDEAYRHAGMALRLAQNAEHWGTAFRAVVLQHRLVKTQNPEDQDRHRLQYLKRLYPKMEEHTVDEDIAYFLKEIGDTGSLTGEGES